MIRGSQFCTQAVSVLDHTIALGRLGGFVQRNGRKAWPCVKVDDFGIELLFDGRSFSSKRSQRNVIDLWSEAGSLSSDIGQVMASY